MRPHQAAAIVHEAGLSNISTPVLQILDELREASTSEADKGSRFEKLTAAFLKADPTYAEQSSDVFLWQDWPGRGGKHDGGIATW